MFRFLFSKLLAAHRRQAAHKNHTDLFDSDDNYSEITDSVGKLTKNVTDGFDGCAAFLLKEAALLDSPPANILICVTGEKFSFR